MNKQRLEWVMSGLNQHALTKAEDHFLQTVSEDFDKHQALTEHQEERLELFYRRKSQFTPNKKHFTFKESSPKRAKPRRRNGDYFNA
jgi:hypothetical protein